MTQKEKGALKQVSERIKSLASMENARFSSSEQYDKTIKDEVRLYMMWFTRTADMLEELANAENIIDKQSAIDNIFRYCN